MKIRILSLALALLLVLGVLSQGSLPARAAGEIPDGYTPIYTVEDLWVVRNNMSKNYILMNDLDMTEALAQGGSLYDATNGWVALGYSDASANCVAFTGTFDGNGHSISGLRCTGLGAGLFWTNKGTIRNLTLASGSLTGSGRDAGSFCMYNSGLIENCRSAVNITASGSGGYCRGGITGWNQSSGKIRDCGNTGSISVSGGGKIYDGYDYYRCVGGITGGSIGLVECVWNYGDISASGFYDQSAGGIVGRDNSASVLVRNAYNTGAVTATCTSSSVGHTAAAGGICGHCYATPSISKCYSAGRISAGNSYSSGLAYIGGICGYVNSTVTSITNCYFLNNMTKGVGNSTTDSCVSLSSFMMQRQDAFAGFDFENVWEMGTGEYRYPVFKGQNEPACTHENTVEIPAVPATCTESGKSAGVQCADCGEILSGCEVIPALGHAWDSGIVTTEASCTAPGVRTFTCTRCEQTRTMSLPALGHAWDEGIVTTEPTCTEDGVKTYTCPICNEIRTEALPALGHAYVDGTCSRCGEKDPAYVDYSGRYYIAAQRPQGSYYYMTSFSGVNSVPRYLALDAEAESLPETITAPEAEMVFRIEKAGEGFKIAAEGINSSNCYLGWAEGDSGLLVSKQDAAIVTISKVGEFVHIFTDSGRSLALNSANDYFAWYPDTTTMIKDITLIPVIEEAEPDASDLTIRGASICLNSDLSIKFYLEEAALEGWTDVRLNASKNRYNPDGSVTAVEAQQVEEAETVTVNGIAYRVFQYSGIHANEMGSEITAKIVASKNGETFSGEAYTYSVLQYCQSMLAKTQDAKLKTLLADLLNYGAAAQVYWNYNTAKLVNAGLSSEQQSYATQINPTLTSCKALVKNEGASISFKTCTLSLKEKVTINYYLNLVAYSGQTDALYAVVSYTGADGQTKSERIDGEQFVQKVHTDGKTYAVVCFDGLNAGQMRTACTVEIFDRTTGERLSDTACYSIESYAYSKASAPDAKLVTLVNEMMKYGDSVNAYFTQTVG